MSAYKCGRCRAHWVGLGPTTAGYIGNRYFVKDFTLLDNLMFRPLVITSLSDCSRRGVRGVTQVEVLEVLEVSSSGGVGGDQWVMIGQATIRSSDLTATSVPRAWQRY